MNVIDSEENQLDSVLLNLILGSVIRPLGLGLGLCFRVPLTQNPKPCYNAGTDPNHNPNLNFKVPLTWHDASRGGDVSLSTAAMGGIGLRRYALYPNYSLTLFTAQFKVFKIPKSLQELLLKVLTFAPVVLLLLRFQGSRRKRFPCVRSYV